MALRRLQFQLPRKLWTVEKTGQSQREAVSGLFKVEPYVISKLNIDSGHDIYSEPGLFIDWVLLMLIIEWI